LATAPPALAHYWAPRYWPTWLFLLWLKITAALPWRVAIAVHKRLGALIGALLLRRRFIVRRNLELCFRELGSRQIDALVRRHFESVGAFVAETALAWFGSADELTRRFRIEGFDNVESALARGKGVLLYTGHFTTLEVCVPAIKPLMPVLVGMFRTRSDPLLTAMQARSRERAAHVLLANNDIREVLRLLGENAVIWYAPDQARIESGELLPFFGEPAMISTATSRLARLSGAAVVPFSYRRLPDDDSYVARFHAPLEGLPSDDAAGDTVRLTRVLEAFIRDCPDQYQWTHRKFKDRPGNLPNVYARP
jgi:KDO2-lipid IV(A) lauroyltransferase